nr:hypothetical protein [Symmachiella macrocystis]
MHATGILWDVETGRKLHRFPSVDTINISPNGNTIVTGSRGGDVTFWQADSGKEIATLKEHAGALKRIQFRADGNRMATTGNDTTVKVWDVHSRQVIHTFYGHDGPVTDVAFSPNSDHVASCGWDLVSRVWDTASRHELMWTGPNQLNGICFSPDGKFLLAGTGNKLMVYDANSRELIWERKETGYSSQWSFPARYDEAGHLIASGRSDGSVSPVASSNDG